MNELSIKVTILSVVAEVPDVSPEERLALAKQWFEWIMEGQQGAEVTQLGAVN